jgi:phasin
MESVMSEVSTRQNSAKTKSSPDAGVSNPGFFNQSFFNPSAQFPEFKMTEIPAALREITEQSGARAKENLEKMRKATDELSQLVEETFSAAVSGSNRCGLKLIEFTRTNAMAAFDVMAKLASVNSPPEVGEVMTSYLRTQIDIVSRQNIEIMALAQKSAAEAIEPIKARLVKGVQQGV